MQGFLLPFARTACGPLALASSYSNEMQRLKERGKHILHITVLVDPVKIDSVTLTVGCRVAREVE
jgi:hypothetical protein